MKLRKGIYENIISGALAKDIAEAEEGQLVCERRDIDTAESPAMLSEYLAEVIRRKLGDENLNAEQRARFVNKIVRLSSTDEGDLMEDAEKYLAEVKTKAQTAKEKATGKHTIRPLSGFRVSNLFTGGSSELSLASEIEKDIATADEICIIVSFLRLSGLHLILDSLKRFCATEGHSLRVITTTYCGITEAKAVEQLSELPRTQIRISYDTRVERLHAKSYIFVRQSGLSTAYIGSSNLSRSAQTDGLEWNIRVTNVENPHIIKSALATFDMYWNSPKFEDFSIGGIEKFRQEMREIRQNPTPKPGELQRYSILLHQKEILEKLAVERQQGCHRNLIVAATGTGKTVISAFDYREFALKHTENHRLLFIAHREEILRQSLQTYRSVMQDANFGDLWVGNYRPDSGIDHLFVSVQTFNSHFSDVFAELPRNYYDFIVVDEAHHIVASSYRRVVNHFQPQLLVGLTATPERMDGSSLLPDFDGHISAEIRLPKALDEGLLTPFQYFCISDDTDLSDESLWQSGRNGHYITSKLSERLCDKQRTSLIINRLSYYINDETKCRALCFCADMKHARYTAEQFSACGLKAACLTSDNSDERQRLNSQLERGEINYLCVVDMFNEGVDIPSVDTVIFLRPTESLTIFLQQLGRGLRLYPGKNLLTVLDFVAQVNRNYDFASRFRALFLKQGGSVEEQLRNGFTLLPHGCSIHMEEKARTYVLQSIKAAIYNKNRLVAELQSYATTPTLAEFIAGNGQDIRLIYKGSLCWTALKRMAGRCQYEDDAITKRLEKGMGQIVHINSVRYLRFIQRVANNHGHIEATTADERTFALMLYYSLFQEKLSRTVFTSIYEALSQLKNYPLFTEELLQLTDYLLHNLSMRTVEAGADCPSSLDIYGCYTREEIFCIYGVQTPEKKMQGAVSGLFKVDAYNTELLFVTLNKSDKDFSPSTQYEDYVVSERLFHWQSQNSESHSRGGQRFVNQSTNHKHFMIFVRENKNDGFGNTCPFYCFGFGQYVSSSGDRPMNVLWSMEHSIMPQFLKAM